MLSGWEYLTLPEQDTNLNCRLAPSRHCYLFTYCGRMESWVCLGWKEGRTNIQISAKLWIEPGALLLEGRDFTNCANHACPLYCFNLLVFILTILFSINMVVRIAVRWVENLVSPCTDRIHLEVLEVQVHRLSQQERFVHYFVEIHYLFSYTVHTILLQYQRLSKSHASCMKTK